MKIFYGEKLVSSKEHLANNKNLIHHGKKLLVLSESDFTELTLKNRDKLVLWGKIYAIIKDNGKYQTIDMTTDGKTILKNIFNKFNLKDIVQKVEGTYIACLIKENEEAIIFCDSFNQKDVFYKLEKDGIKASMDLANIISKSKKSYDQAALANLLFIYGMYSPKKHTIYKEVRRLGVGEYIILKRNKVQIEKIPFKPLKVGKYGEKDLNKYFSLLNDAVKIKGSRNNNWIYLSSGWDSTSLLSLLVKNFGSSHVKAVTGKMIYSERAKDANIFEIKRAQKIAEYYSVDIDVVPFDYTKKDSVKHWEKIKPFLKDNHIYADNSINFHLLSEHIMKRSKSNDSVFCGEISDGVHNLGFAQYSTILEHPVVEFREYSDKMASYLFGPTFFKSIINGSYSKDAVYKLLRSRLEGHYFEDEKELDEYQRKSKLISSFFIRNRRIPFYGLKNNKFFTSKGAELFESEMFDEYLKECIDKIEPDTIYSWILHLYNSFHWQGSTVKSMPETARFNNLNFTMPFWDIRLQNFLHKMPENWGRGLDFRPTKYPLKWMLENKVDYPSHLQIGPHSYLYDVDPDFSLESEIMFHSSLSPHFQKTLKDYPFEKVLDKQYFNIDYFKKLTDDYVNGVEPNGQRFSHLYNLIWLCWIGWY